MEEEFKLRPLFCEFNPLSRPDGSTLFAQGNTSVIAAMYGPIEVRQQNMKPDKAHVNCVYRSIARLPTIRDKFRESIIRDTCESAILTALHPRTQITVQVQELDDFGGIDACAINAACLALLIGGVPMKFTFAAVHCVVDKDGQLVLDPDELTDASHRASLTFVFDSIEKELVTVHATGRIGVAQLNDAEMLARSASDTIFKFYRQTIADFHSRPLPTRENRKTSTDKKVVKT